MIFVSVRTFVHGFDELIQEMDFICEQNQYKAFAQIGNSSVLPENMRFARFLTIADMRKKMKEANIIVCHGGFGILGDAMRAEKPIIAVPRQTETNSVDNPSNNQRVVVEKLRVLFNINVCMDIGTLHSLVNQVISQTNGMQKYDLQCNVPALITNFLSNLE